MKPQALRIETVPIAALKLDPRNARVHGARNLQAIRESLKQFGQAKPLVVSLDDVVIAGNGTLTAAAALGWTEVQIVRVDLDEKERAAFAIADNRTAELAEWDPDVLADTWRSLDAELQGATGILEAELEEIAKKNAVREARPLRPPVLVSACRTTQVVHCGDSLEVLRQIPAGSVHAIVTDPPYGLSFMGHRWDYDVPGVELWAECLRVLKPGGHLLAFFGTRTYHRGVVRIEDAGFEIRDMVAWVYSQGFPKSLNLDHERGLRFCGCAAAPLPYAHEEAVPGEPEAERQVRPVRHADVPPTVAAGEGRGEVLQPSVPEQSAPAHRSAQGSGEHEGAAESGVEGRRHAVQAQGQLHRRDLRSRAGVGEADGAEGRLHHGAPARDGEDVRLSPEAHGGRGSPGPQPVQQSAVQSGALPDERGPQTRGGWEACVRCGKPIVPCGFGTGLKPAMEPIVLARKPLRGTVAQNILTHGTGALNVDGCRVGGWGGSATGGGAVPIISGPAGEARPVTGRWPANVIHDGSEEVVELFPNVEAGVAVRHQSGGKNCHSEQAKPPMADMGYGDTGSAARFFYCAKPGTGERDVGLDDLPVTDAGVLEGRQDGSLGSITRRKNIHPTVKPLDLMRYLVRLVTPPGGTVLDPFLGSGTTLMAAALEGLDGIGVEREEKFAELARKRIAAVSMPLLEDAGAAEEPKA